MKKSWVSIVLMVLFVLAAIAAVGIYEYRAGVAQGMTMSAKLPAAGPGWPYPYWYGRFPPFGFIFPLLLIFLFLVLARGIFWLGRWNGFGHAGCDRQARFDEWHRKAHQSMASDVPR